MKQILKDAFTSSELEQHLIDIIAVDDKCKVEDISDKTIIKEAKYVLSKYIGGEGFDQEDEYNGDRGEEAQKFARKEVKILQKFIKKYN